MSPELKTAIPVCILAAALISVITPCAAGIHVQASHDIVLAKGDPLTITGAGYHNGSATLWGTGYSFLDSKVVNASPTGTIVWTLDPETTQTFHSGPFMIIVEDPGQDRNYSISANVSAGKFRMISADGIPLFETEAQANNISAALDLANLLKNQINRSGTDDSCVIQTVYVEEPALHLSTVELGSALVVPAGEYVLVNGTMNMAPENLITARMYDTDVIEETGLRIPVRPATVVATERGAWENTWEYTLDTAGLEPGEYLVEVGWNRSQVSGQNAFLLQVIQPENRVERVLNGLLWRIPRGIFGFSMM